MISSVLTSYLTLRRRRDRTGSHDLDRRIKRLPDKQAQTRDLPDLPHFASKIEVCPPALPVTRSRAGRPAAIEVSTFAVKSDFVSADRAQANERLKADIIVAMMLRHMRLCRGSS
jgi:hypothetical protein